MAARQFLLRTSRDVGRKTGEGVLQCVGEQRHHGDKGEAHGGGDQTIFNGGRTGFVLHKTHKLGHFKLH